MLMTFVDRLQMLSFVEASIIIPSTLALIVFLLPYIRAKLGMNVAADVSDGIVEGVNAISLFFVFVVASSLAIVQTHQKEGSKIVDKEIASIVALDRDLVRIPTTDAGETREALANYVRKIISDEWPLLADGKSSETVDRAFGVLMTRINHFNGSEATRETLITAVDRISEVREERLEIANEHLSPIYWGMVFAFIGLLIVMSAFTSPALAKRASIASKIVALSFSLVMLIQTDGVFSGDISVTPAQYVKTVQKMKVRTIDTD